MHPAAGRTRAAGRVRAVGRAVRFGCIGNEVGDKARHTTDDAAARRARCARHSGRRGQRRGHRGGRAGGSLRRAGAARFAHHVVGAAGGKHQRGQADAQNQRKDFFHRSFLLN